MTLICPTCQSRLQLDDTKTPAQPFTVRCPKCQTPVKLQPSSANAGEAPHEPSVGFHLERKLAPRFTLDGQETVAAETVMVSQEFSDLGRLLAEALRNSKGFEGKLQERNRNRRKVLLCAAPEYQTQTARTLAENNYEVYVAENTSQALGSMREDRMDVLLLDANFDPVEQGTAFVMREVKLLRPAQRRRLFLTYISPSVRTLDLHAAFLHNVNLLFNPADLEKLPEVLEATIRNYNELYRDFFTALNVQHI